MKEQVKEQVKARLNQQVNQQVNQPSSGRPLVTAFGIWFVHFMVLWAAGEIWPHQWAANALAWGFTAVALLAVGMHGLQLKVQLADGRLSGWSHRFAQGAAAIATVAMVFTALPSFVFLP